MLALLATGSGEFHAHSNLGVHDAHHAFRSILELSSPHDQHNSRTDRKRRSHFQVATSQAEIRKPAGNGWIVWLHFWRMLRQPRLELVALFGGEIDEAN